MFLVRAAVTIALVAIPAGAFALMHHRRRTRPDPEKESRLCKLLRAKNIKAAQTLVDSLGCVSSSLLLLNLAAATGAMQLVEILMKKMPGWREAVASMEKGDMETTPLHVAAVHGFVPIASLLLEGGVSANVTDLSDQTPLFLAASGGHSDMVLLLLKHGADVFQQTRTLKAAVHYAAHLGQDDILRIFAAHLAGRTGDDERDGVGKETATAEIASGYKDDLARLMNLKDISGYASLHVACLGGSVATVKLLLSFDADANKAATDGSTSLHLATQPSNKNTSTELVRTLLDAGADPMLMTTFGSTPLHLACSAARTAIIKEILASAASKGAVKDLLAVQDNDGMLAIHSICHAVTTKRFDTEGDVFASCDLLLAHGADVNGADYGDATVLHYLVAVPPSPLAVSLISHFVDKGAKVTLENGQGWTPLHAILNHKRTEETAEIRAIEAFLRTAATREDPSFPKSFAADKPRDVSNRKYLARRGPHNRIPIAVRTAVLQGDHTLKGIAHYIQRTIREKGGLNIVIMAGAGTSVSAGVPDFRSPKSGLYQNPQYQHAFSLEALHEDPDMFVKVLHDVFLPVIRGKCRPTSTHHFFRLLHDKGLLRRLYTQNVDTLDRRVGLPEDKIVEAHGTLACAHCIVCGKSVTSMDAFWDCVEKLIVCKCSCGGLIAPDVVFFGQGLPDVFVQKKDDDLASADLLIVLGTSLVVYPFAAMANQVGLLTPRLLVNKTLSGVFQHLEEQVSEADAGAAEAVATSSNYRDVAHISACDDGILELCEHLGWSADLKALISQAN